MPAPCPSLYLSHGSPMIALESSPAALFLDRLGPAIDAAYGRPRAVLIVSPHTATSEPVVQTAARHAAMHDFGGFPDTLYTLRYDAPGEPEVAARAVQLLQHAGLPVQARAGGYLDHGIWTVLRRMWPAADVPVVPMSLVPQWDAQRQWAVGEALAPLREQGVLVIGSGSLTHNLRRYFTEGSPEDGSVAPDVQAFRAWVHERVQALDWAALREWEAAPGARRQHPSDEHWLPFYIAAGAGGGAAGARIHASVDAGLLAMDAYAFGAEGKRLLSLCD